MTTPQILIVGDETAAASDLEARLTGLGYQVAVATPDTLDGPEEVVVLRARSDAGKDVRPTVEPAGVPPTLTPSSTEREVRAVVELACSQHEAARATREFEAFFSVAIDLFCVLDFNGYFRRLNAAWERTLGFTRQELMSRPFIEFVHPDDRAPTLAQNARVRAGGQARDFENRYLCKDGSFRWFRWNATPFVGQVVYSVARDITARKQAEAERERLIGELKDSLADVKALQAILPICSYCRKIRDDKDYWHTVESYLSAHTRTRFSHGICPDCAAREFGGDIKDSP